LKKAVFLDRDGVINRVLVEKGPRETPTKPEELELLPGIPEALARLKTAGHLLVVVTNQPNIAKGKCSREDYSAIEKRLIELVGEGVLDAVYVCFHHPDPNQVVEMELLGDCDCRKPKPGLILLAAKQHDIDLQQSWLVGDSETDIAAGLAAGIPTNQLILIGSGSTIGVATSSLLEAAIHITGE